MTKSILLVSYFAPCRGHAGGLRLLELYREIKRIVPEINLELVTCQHPEVDWGIEELPQIFNKVYWLAVENYSFKGVLSIDGLNKDYDCIDLQYHQSGAFIGNLKKKYPKARIIFSPMESMIHAARLAIQKSRQHFTVKQLLQHMWLALREAYYVINTDSTICVSEPDFYQLRFLKRDNIFYISTGLLFNAHTKNYQRLKIFDKVVIFSAFFGSKTNSDALVWFINFVHPLIKLAVPDYTFKIIGRGANASLIAQCQVDGVQFIGEVKEIEAEFQFASVGIAPALSGAGFRGKINQYASVCLPCVATSIAAKGFKYENGKSILIADNPVAFAESCIKLLADKDYCVQMGQEAQRVCLSHYTWSSMEANIIEAYNLIA